MNRQQVIKELRAIHERWMGQGWEMLNGQGKTKRYPSDELRNALHDFRKTPEEHIKISEGSGLPIEWRLSSLLTYWMIRVFAFLKELEHEADEEISGRLLDYIREESRIMQQIGTLSFGVIAKKRGPAKGAAKRKMNANVTVSQEVEAAKRCKSWTKSVDGYSISFEDWQKIVRTHRGNGVRDSQIYRDRDRARTLLKRNFDLISKI